jgi:NDP-sugar pyrophosphorylase family protein
VEGQGWFINFRKQEPILHSPFSLVQDSKLFISGGIYCLRRSAIQVLEKAMAEGISRMRNYQSRLISEGLYLKAYPFTKIIDVDHAEDIAKAEAFFT